MRGLERIPCTAARMVVPVMFLLLPIFAFGDAGSDIPKLIEVKRIYTSQIGVREQGFNAGKQVEAYLRYVGLPKGNPWCAAFVCWVYGQAGVANPRTGWSPALFPSSKVIWMRGRVISPEGESGSVRDAPDAGRSFDHISNNIFAGSQVFRNPAPRGSRLPGTADIFAIYFPEKGRIVHTGFIDEWKGDWLITVEGNTNDSGSREGDGVYRKRRPVSSIYQVARYVERERREGL